MTLPTERYRTARERRAQALADVAVARAMARATPPPPPPTQDDEPAVDGDVFVSCAVARQIRHAIEEDHHAHH